MNPALIHARILTAPRLKYHDTGSVKSFQPREGQWNMKNKKMVNGGTVNSWTCINFAPKVSTGVVLRFCNALAQMCCDSGMEFNPKPILELCNVHPEQVDTALKALHNKAKTFLKPYNRKFDLLIVVLPDKNGFLYGTDLFE
ncbi:hypothetical protein HHK36_024143 [Tetracentron sinense]|uniref:Protein argonaute Mid domain-containing protein n=1 Tax=Tetracentron sinense TaxID=13715 RepID=A0A834YIH4_TETSI|nr:hypothetical protein HHK36_024143 [Tetracentron sinense]